MDAPSPAAHRIADRSLAEFMDGLATPAPAPGSGAAAAVAIALAAGCAAKAAAVSLSRRNTEALESGVEMGRAIAAAALAGAAEEQASFRKLLQAMRRGHRRDATDEVLEVAEGLLTCVAAVRALADRLEPETAPELVGDLLAARALADAAQLILEANQAEAARP